MWFRIQGIASRCQWNHTSCFFIDRHNKLLKFSKSIEVYHLFALKYCMTFCMPLTVCVKSLVLKTSLSPLISTFIIAIYDFTQASLSIFDLSIKIDADWRDIVLLNIKLNRDWTYGSHMSHYDWVIWNESYDMEFEILKIK